MLKKVLYSLLALLLAVSVVSGTSANPVANAVTAWEELEGQIDEIDSKIKANQAKLDALKDKADSQKEYLETLESQIEAVESKYINLQTQIDTIDNQITKLNNEIKQLNNEIEEINNSISKAKKEIKDLETNISETSYILAARIRSSYVNGYDSTLKILLGSDSLSSFLTRLELMKRTSENDKKTIEEFRDKITSLNKTKEKLEDDKVELDKKKDEVSSKRNEKASQKDELKKKQNEYKNTAASLEVKYGEIETYVENLDKSSAAYKAYISELQSEKAAADAELDRIISEYYATSVATTTTRLDAENANPNQTTKPTTSAAGPSYQGSGNWYWPVGNASCYISSYFGPRPSPTAGASSNHGAIDITGGGISGKPVYASRAGTVITSTNGSGYGNYIIIDHGDGYSSVYAHMSTRLVATGAKVSQGQMIGRVGSTGISTGPHLHFEVRHNGVRQNPLNFVKKP